MADDALASLYDIRNAAIAIIEFIAGKRFADYEADDFCGAPSNENLRSWARRLLESTRRCPRCSLELETIAA